MINLLPPSLKDEYRYARRNAGLRRTVVLFAFGIVGLAVIAATGMWYLDQSTKAYTVQAAISEARLREQKQDVIDKQVLDISNSLKLAVQVLSKEVLFSQLLTQLAVITPSNVTLNGLSISQLTGGLDIIAKTTNYDAATQLQVNIADPNNKIFSKADLVNITCVTASDSSSSQPSRYPCTATIRAQFATDNPFLFINSKGIN
jgi:hypothetical protein